MEYVIIVIAIRRMDTEILHSLRATREREKGREEEEEKERKGGRERRKMEDGGRGNFNIQFWKEFEMNIPKCSVHHCC